MKTEEEYQEAIELTPDQQKAFAALVRAVNRCKKENIYFYQCLETLGALNGNNVYTIHCDDDLGYRSRSCEDPACLQDKSYPTVDTDCSFADDNHFIELHDE